MKIYVASSWRNVQQPAVVEALRAAGHEVYDFRHPAPGNDGFQWSAIDPDWQRWNGEQFAAALKHPIAEAGYGFDKAALDWCNACVLVMPSGRSAHLEAGYTIGQGKPTAILLEAKQEPELMYKLAAAYVLSIEDIVRWANGVETGIHIKRGLCSYCSCEGDLRGTPILADVQLKARMCETCWGVTREGGIASEGMDIGPFHGYRQMTPDDVLKELDKLAAGG